jgi:hypothetical protein
VEGYILIVVVVVILAIVMHLLHGDMDRGRIKQYVETRGGQLIDASRKPFGPVWVGRDRIYDVRFLDIDGRQHRARCKTSGWSGILFTDDSIERQAYVMETSSRGGAMAGKLEPAARFQVPLYKLFLIIAVYAAAFGALSYLGSIGFIIAAIVGTTSGLLVILIRDRNSVLSGTIVAAGSLTGAVLADVLIVPPIVIGYTVADGFRDWVIMSVGTVLGGLISSRASKR